MAYEERLRNTDGTQNIIIENRNKLSVSGVESVISFDEVTIIVETVSGTLLIHGSDLHLEKLNLDNGEIKVEGTIDSLEYEDTAPKGGGLLSKLFR